MAAVLHQQNVGVRKIGQTVHVPDHPIASMMYYLNCMCNVLDLSNNSNISRLTDYRNYLTLSEDETDALTALCVLLGPDELEGKCIFNNAALCGTSQNEFYELEAVTNQLLITNSVLIGGKQTRVRKIMTYKTEWMNENYLLPAVILLARLKARVDAENNRAISYDHSRSDAPRSCCSCNIL